MRLALVVAICLVSNLCSAQTDRQLVDRYDKLVSVENYAGALKAAQTIVDRYPESATWQFNLGCMLTRANQTNQALEALEQAAELGYTGIRSFQQSEDLDPLREDEQFKEILTQVQRNADARLNEFIREARRHQPKIHIPDTIPESPALILALHGTGMRGQDMIDALQSTADELAFILIAPDALRPAGDGFSWTYRDESEWMIEDQITKAISEQNINPDQIYLVGFSQGANITLTMGQTHPDQFAGVVPICGHYEPQVASSENDAELPPFYLMTGARDPWNKTYINAKKDLTDAGAPVQVRVLAGKGHEIPSGKLGLKELTKAIKWCISQNKSQSVDLED